MYRYRYEGGRSLDITGHGNLFPLRKLEKLGKLEKVMGVRYRGWRTGSSGRYMAEFEVIRVYGEHGMARFTGVCWGYSGSGPQATHALLLVCGLKAEEAERYAFRTERGSRCGVDWEHRFV